jgi:uncharacterized membrane protein YdjX (TVP38/TMEM64 family)
MSPDRNRTWIAVQAVLMALFVAAVVILTIKYGPAITRLFSQPERTRDYLRSFGLAAPLVYVLVHAVQVILAFIPGEVVQIAGGYVFGTVLGALYSVVGVALGTLVAFLVVKAVGSSLVKAVVPDKTYRDFEFLVNKPHADVMIFVSFLIPGIPKDALTYIAGLTPIKTTKFLIVSMLGRLPGLLGSAYIGANLQKKHYWPVLIISAAAVILFAVGVFFRDRIVNLISSRWRGGPKVDSRS